MAKDRDGSINIYGSLQAKTEDGYVAYTDGIAHENEDGTITPLDQLLKNGIGGGGGGSAIVDVDVLPEEPKSDVIYRLKEGQKELLIGNQIVSNPETTVEKIYFNTTLSNNQINDILSNLTYFENSGQLIYSPFSNAYGTNTILIIKTIQDEKINYNILYSTNIANNVFEPIYNSSVGWYVYKEKEINSVGVTSLMGLPIGLENEKLTNLFSMNNDFALSYIDNYEYYIYKLDWEKIITNDNEIILNLGSIVVPQNNLEDGKITTTINIKGIPITQENFLNSKVICNVTDGVGYRTYSLLPTCIFEGQNFNYNVEKSKNNSKLAYDLYNDIECLLKWDSSTETYSAIVTIYENLDEILTLNTSESIDNLDGDLIGLTGGSSNHYSSVRNQQNVSLMIIDTNGNSVVFKKQGETLVNDESNPNLTKIYHFYCQTENYGYILNLNDTGTSISGNIHKVENVNKFYIYDFKQDSNGDLNLVYYDKTGSYVNKKIEVASTLQNIIGTKLVKEGLVVQALENKQDKITVTENADGTVDITIPTE